VSEDLRVLGRTRGNNGICSKNDRLVFASFSMEVQRV
jgi:hypothetical protein